MDLTGIILTLLTSLLLTLAVELGLAFLLGVRGRSAMLLVALVNLATNPAVVYTYIIVRMFAGRGTADGLMPFLEIGAVLLEAWLYANTPGMMDPNTFFYRKRPMAGIIAGPDDRTAGRPETPVTEKEKPGRSETRPGLRSAASALLLSVLLNAASFAAGKLVSML